MLVLSRKTGEEIFFGDHIRLLVVRIGGSKVRLGIQAPSVVPILRGEIDGASSPSSGFQASGSGGMLVLSRAYEQQIIIDGNIVVTVIEIASGQVRLGIEAPKEVKILRGELYNSSQTTRLDNPSQTVSLIQSQPDQEEAETGPQEQVIAKAA